MRATAFPIGLLISTAGPYAEASAGMLAGALLAIDEVNAGPLPVRLVPRAGDPRGELARYATLGDEMLAAGIRHVVGCYTSSSRKEIIPLFEKGDALLWYPSPTSICCRWPDHARPAPVRRLPGRSNDAAAPVGARGGAGSRSRDGRGGLGPGDARCARVPAEAQRAPALP